MITHCITRTVLTRTHYYSVAGWLPIITEVKVKVKLKVNYQSQSQSHIATDGLSISKSWCRAPSGAHGQIFITVWQLRSWFHGAPSLMRVLLALASVVFLVSESLGTRDHILLSQIWDFPFCRLLRLARSRWRSLSLLCRYIVPERTT
jgi:hypothetical protein